MVKRIRTHFLKDLTLTDAVGLGMGFIIGSGIYIMPMLMARQIGIWSLLAWVLGGFFCIITGLCFAECAIRIPKVGGLYAYAHKALGDFWGFLTGYTFWLGYIVTIAAEILAIAWYLDFFWSVALMPRIAVACTVAFVFTYVNYRGVKLGGRIEDFLTIGKILPLIFFIGLGALFFKPENFTAATTGIGALPLLGSVILALWAYQGAEIITVPEEEIKHAKKTVPRAIIISIFTVMLIYVLVGASLISLNWTPFANSEAPLADLASSVVGRWGGFILAIGGLISILGALNAVILASSRISYAMSKDKLFPKLFGHLHEKHETPDHALVIHLAIALVLSFAIQDFTQLATIVVIFTLVPYLFSCIATYCLQKKKHHIHSILGNNQVLPVIAIIASVLLFAYSWYGYKTISTSLILIGIFWFFVMKRSFSWKKIMHHN